jgi:hypothetical protein
VPGARRAHRLRPVRLHLDRRPGRVPARQRQRLPRQGRRRLGARRDRLLPLLELVLLPAQRRLRLVRVAALPSSCLFLRIYVI